MNLKYFHPLFRIFNEYNLRQSSYSKFLHLLLSLAMVATAQFFVLLKMTSEDLESLYLIKSFDDLNTK